MSNDPVFSLNAASILWIGNAQHPEFTAVRAALHEAAAPVVECGTMRQALELDPADDCALIVVAEALPGEHLRVGYEALRRVRPTVPIVRVCGSLCEGEMRTNPPPPAIRYGWLRAATALADDWRRLQRGACPSWGRPAAASDEERLLADLPVGSVEPLPLRAVGLAVQEPATAAWLTDFLQRRGVQAARLGRETASEPPSVDAILWDRPLDAVLQESEFAQLRRMFPQTPLIVLAGFPRVDEVRALCNAGAAAVLAKPLAAGELEAALRAVAKQNSIAVERVAR